MIVCRYQEFEIVELLESRQFIVAKMYPNGIIILTLTGAHDTIGNAGGELRHLPVNRESGSNVRSMVMRCSIGAGYQRCRLMVMGEGKLVGGLELQAVGAICVLIRLLFLVANLQTNKQHRRLVIAGLKKIWPFGLDLLPVRLLTFSQCFARYMVCLVAMTAKTNSCPQPRRRRSFLRLHHRPNVRRGDDFGSLLALLSQLRRLCLKLQTAIPKTRGIGQTAVGRYKQGKSA